MGGGAPVLSTLGKESGEEWRLQRVRARQAAAFSTRLRALVWMSKISIF